MEFHLKIEVLFRHALKRLEKSIRHFSAGGLLVIAVGARNFQGLFIGRIMNIGYFHPPSIRAFAFVKDDVRMPVIERTPILDKLLVQFGVISGSGMYTIQKVPNDLSTQLGSGVPVIKFRIDFE